MKKLFSVFVALFAAIVFVSAQTNIEKLIVNYQFKYSNMIIDGMEAKGFVAIHENEGKDTPDIAFEKFTQQVETIFISAANGQLLQKSNLRLDNSSDSRYLLMISFQKVDKDGEHNVICSLYDNEQKEYIDTFISHADGGMFGSFMNLFSECLSKSGKKVGKKLNSILKKRIK